MNTHDIEQILRSYLTDDGYIAADDIPNICKAIEADRQRRGEPVGWAVAYTNRQPILIVATYAVESSAREHVEKQSALSVVPLYAAPQPADPVKDAVRIYNSGYMAGHQDTVEGCFTDILSADMASYHEDVVSELVDDLLGIQPAEPVKRKRPYAQGSALGEFGVIPMCDQVDDEPVKVPSDAISVVGMPEFDALMDFIYENGTASEGVTPLANAFARALLARYGQLAQPAHALGGSKEEYTRVFNMGRNSAQPSVPEGWRLVPVEPTPEMYMRGGEEFADSIGSSNHDGDTLNDQDHAASIYRAMILVTPQPAEPVNVPSDTQETK